MSDVHQKLIEKFKDEPFSIIDERGTILNKTHLSSMGYATHVPYSVVGLDDLLTSINELVHEKEDLEKENEQLQIQIESCRNQQIRQANKIHEILKEKEQLKQSIHNKMDSDAYWEKKAKQRVQELEKENGRLKTLKRCYQNNLESYVEALHEEYDKADGELKAALSVVLSKKYDCEEL